MRIALRIFLVLLFAEAVRAGGPRPVSLDEALRYAGEYHPLVTAAEKRVAEGGWDVAGARSALYPSIQAGAAASKGMYGAYSGLGFRGLANSPFKSGYGIDVELEQILYDFGRTSNMVRTAEAQVEELRADRDATLLRVLLEVRRRYAECLRAGPLVAVRRAAVGEMERVAREVERYVARGERPAVDLALVRATENEAKIRAIDAEEGREAAVDALSLSMGAPEGERYQCTPEDGPFHVPEMPPLDAVLKEALSQRPEMFHLAAVRRKLESEERAARSDFFPRIIGTASAGRLQDTVIVPAESYALGIGVRIPLFEGFATRSKLHRAEVGLDRLEEDERMVRNEIISEVRQTLERFNSLRRILPFSAARRDEAERALRLARSRYIGRSGTLSEWEEAHQLWISSEVELLDVEYRLRLAMAELTAAAGEY